MGELCAIDIRVNVIVTLECACMAVRPRHSFVASLRHQTAVLLPPASPSDLKPQVSGWGGEERRDPAPCPWLPCGVQERRVQRGPMAKGKEMSLQGPVLEIGGMAGPRTHTPKWEASGNMKGQLKASCTGPHREITLGAKAAGVTRPPHVPTAWSQPLLTKPLGRWVPRTKGRDLGKEETPVGILTRKMNEQMILNLGNENPLD